MQHPNCWIRSVIQAEKSDEKLRYDNSKSDSQKRLDEERNEQSFAKVECRYGKRACDVPWNGKCETEDNIWKSCLESTSTKVFIKENYMRSENEIEQERTRMVSKFHDFLAVVVSPGKSPKKTVNCGLNVENLGIENKRTSQEVRRREDAAKGAEKENNIVGVGRADCTKKDTEETLPRSQLRFGTNLTWSALDEISKEEESSLLVGSPALEMGTSNSEIQYNISKESDGDAVYAEHICEQIELVCSQLQEKRGTPGFSQDSFT